MYDYLDLRQTEKLKELVPYKALAPDADEIIKELERLNNIINELEKDIEKKIYDIKNNYSQVNGNYFNMNYVIDTYEDVLDKLKELKDSD